MKKIKVSISLENLCELKRDAVFYSYVVREKAALEEKVADLEKEIASLREQHSPAPNPLRKRG